MNNMIDNISPTTSILLFTLVAFCSYYAGQLGASILHQRRLKSTVHLEVHHQIQLSESPSASTSTGDAVFSQVKVEVEVEASTPSESPIVTKPGEKGAKGKSGPFGRASKFARRVFTPTPDPSDVPTVTTATPLPPPISPFMYSLANMLPNYMAPAGRSSPRKASGTMRQAKSSIRMWRGVVSKA